MGLLRLLEDPPPGGGGLCHEEKSEPELGSPSLLRHFAAGRIRVQLHLTKDILVQHLAVINRARDCFVGLPAKAPTSDQGPRALGAFGLGLGQGRANIFFAPFFRNCTSI